MTGFCPTCGQPVILTATYNERNGKWTVLPLDGNDLQPGDEGNFILPGGEHEAVDIMGNVVGVFPVSAYVEMSPAHRYRTHQPSHYLDADG